MPKVSVIMGIYNCAATLQEALDSLYNQSFQDFEIILCDDGSIDNTYEVAKNNSLKYSDVIVLRNEGNKGLNFTLNKCLERSSGEYIARMDGDDISLPSRFEKEVHFLDEHPEYSIVSCPMIYFDDEGEFRRGKAKGEPSINVFNSGSPFCHAPCMVRRSAFIDVEGYTVDPHLIRYEDYDLWVKLYSKGYRGYNLEECLYAMRDDKNAAKRRKLRTRFNGIYAHWKAYRLLHLSLWRFIEYSVTVIILGILPIPIYNFFHKKIKGN